MAHENLENIGVLCIPLEKKKGNTNCFFLLKGGRSADIMETPLFQVLLYSFSQMQPGFRALHVVLPDAFHK